MGKQTQPAAETYQVRLSENALKNIDEITEYIAAGNDQPRNAIRVGDSFYESFDRIKRRPFAYKECLLIPKKIEKVSPKSLFQVEYHLQGEWFGNNYPWNYSFREKAFKNKGAATGEVIYV